MTTASLQLYTIDSVYGDDPHGTLERLQRIGFTTVEAFNFVHRATDLAATFSRYGLAAKTGHAMLVDKQIHWLDGTVEDVPSWETTFEAANTLGMDTVIDPYVDRERWSTRAEIQATADRLNAAAEVATRFGLEVGYHNHDHELRAQVDGRTGLEVLAELLDPRVRLEVDLYWAAAAGVDLVALLGTLGDRVIAAHVKDGPLGDHIKTGVAPTDQTPAGQGDVPLQAALNAVPDLRYAVIEFDGQQGDILDAVEGSFTWLRGQLAGDVAGATR